MITAFGFACAVGAGMSLGLAEGARLSRRCGPAPDGAALFFLFPAAFFAFIAAWCLA
jgi:hypothetical protein